MDIHVIERRYAEAVAIKDVDAASQALTALAHRVETGERKPMMADAIRLGLFAEYLVAARGSGSPAKRFNRAVSDSDTLDRKDHVFLAEVAGLRPRQVDMVREGSWSYDGVLRRSEAPVTPTAKSGPVLTQRRVVDQKKVEGKVVWAITKVTSGVDVVYELDEGGAKSGHDSLALARAAVGKHIEPPKPAGHGEKTNVPAISQGMKGKSSGGK